MMLDANFSLEAQGLLWCEAMDAATGLANETATTSKDICAYRGFYSVKPLIYDNLQPFRRVGYVTKRTKIRKKFTEKSTKCICLSNAKNHAADVYRVYNTETKSTKCSRDIKWADWHGGQSPTDKIKEIERQQWLD